MTRLAQTLQLAGNEVSPITPVRRDVIHHIRACYNSALQTELAQWMLDQLKPAQPLPACSFIEIVPRNRITANSYHSLVALRSCRLELVLLEQATQIQFRSHPPVPVNRERAKSCTLDVPTGDL